MPLATITEVESLEGLAGTLTAAEPLRAGQPVYLGLDGKLYLSSSAAGLNRGLVDGFARADTAPGADCDLEDRRLILADWTRVTGTVLLVPGTRYFLDGQLGRLAAAPPAGTGVALIRVGVALNGQTLKIQVVDLSHLAGTSGAIAGAAPASAAAAGAVTLTDEISGSAQSTAALAGGPTIVVPHADLAGAAPASAAVSGAVSANDNLTGVGSASATVSGQVSAIDALSGTAPASAAGSATLTTSTPVRNRAFAFGLMGLAA